VAQGVGAALFEEYVYNDEGQPLVSTFVDYLMPTIHEVPMTEKDFARSRHRRSPRWAPRVAAKERSIPRRPPCCCAINDALAPLGVQMRETPASPHRVWSMIRSARGARDSV
jgi:CO/xanthine dehydrogenase Mo-binding subunit